MDVESKIDIIQSFAEEIVTAEELRALLETNEHPMAYDGFEPSGIAPIHFGLQRARNIKKMLAAGMHFTVLLADYFAFINNKLEGSMENIHVTGEYFIEVWKAAGIDTGRIKVVWSKDVIGSLEYWDTMLKIGKATTLNRVKRAITVMGRKEGEDVSAAQLFYPVMQAADIFALGIDICQLGMDQRKADMLAREVAAHYGWRMPIAVHHPLILGLQGMPGGSAGSSNAESFVEYKMSKSNPKSAIYVHDSYAEIKNKINGAYCPEKVVDGNPLFDYIGKIILEDKNSGMEIERPQKFGGNLPVENYDELAEMYKEGRVHPLDIKGFVAGELEKRIRPIREHFENDGKAKELYEKVKGFKITR